jgi:hypothetical protein
LAAASVILALSNPFDGTWKFDAAKSKYTSGAPPKEATLTITTVGDQDQIEGSATTANGSQTSTKYTVPTKGGTGKVITGPWDGVSDKVVNDNTREASYMRGGKEVAHANVVVSKDGKTMRVTVKGTDVQGNPLSYVAVYDKQ